MGVERNGPHNRDYTGQAMAIQTSRSSIVYLAKRTLFGAPSAKISREEVKICPKGHINTQVEGLF